MSGLDVVRLRRGGYVAVEAARLGVDDAVDGGGGRVGQPPQVDLRVNKQLICKQTSEM